MFELDSQPFLIEETVAFCRKLRDRGLAVTPSEAIDATSALGLFDLDDRRETFLGLRTILTSRVEDLPIFEELFEEFWEAISRENQGKLGSGKAAISDRVPARDHRTQKGLAYFLQHWGTSSTQAAEPIKLPGASDTEATAAKDFSGFGADELNEVSRIARRILRRLARRPSRRWKPVRRGRRINLRRSFRQSLRTGGELAELLYRKRKPHKTRLVVLCDVSGSMDLYSRLLLQLIYALQSGVARVETFVFSTGLERITAQLKNKTYEKALEGLSADVRGWSGGTLIGASLASFNTRWPALVDRRTIVVVMSDGWDTGDPELLGEALIDLKRRAGRLIWLNPLAGSADYQPLTQGMQTALPLVDVFAPLIDLQSLRALERHLDL